MQNRTTEAKLYYLKQNLAFITVRRKILHTMCG